MPVYEIAASAYLLDSSYKMELFGDWFYLNYPTLSWENDDVNFYITAPDSTHIAAITAHIAILDPQQIANDADAAAVRLAVQGCISFIRLM